MATRRPSSDVTRAGGGTAAGVMAARPVSGTQQAFGGGTSVISVAREARERQEGKEHPAPASSAREAGRERTGVEEGRGGPQDERVGAARTRDLQPDRPPIGGAPAGNRGRRAVARGRTDRRTPPRPASPRRVAASAAAAAARPGRRRPRPPASPAGPSPARTTAHLPRGIGEAAALGGVRRGEGEVPVILDAGDQAGILARHGARHRRRGTGSMAPPQIGRSSAGSRRAPGRRDLLDHGAGSLKARSAARDGGRHLRVHPSMAKIGAVGDAQAAQPPGVRPPAGSRRAAWCGRPDAGRP